MQYGLDLPTTGPCTDARTLAELAHLAEQSGWDGVFLEDYIVHWIAKDASTCDPWVALAAMAMRTERVLVGVLVTPLSRRPWKLARETVTLDHLSGGRLVVGAGIGDINYPGFAPVGEATDAKQRARMLDEGLEVLVGLWSGRPFSYSGEHFQVRELTLLPAPAQTPHIPIWIGGMWPGKAALRRAVRYDGACLYKQASDARMEDITPDEVRVIRAGIAELRDPSLMTPFDIILGGRRRGPDWERERAWLASVAEAGATWWGEYISPDVVELDEIRAHIERGPLRID